MGNDSADLEFDGRQRYQIIRPPASIPASEANFSLPLTSAGGYL